MLNSTNGKPTDKLNPYYIDQETIDKFKAEYDEINSELISYNSNKKELEDQIEKNIALITQYKEELDKIVSEKIKIDAKVDTINKIDVNAVKRISECNLF